ncbi:hypothetical protein GCM10028801_39220 [Nocardioides maradonensis]
MNAPSHVWLLWHGDDIYDETPEAKLLGVYASEELARERIERCARLPGFRDHPEAFEIARYEVNRDEWSEGYVVLTG